MEELDLVRGVQWDFSYLDVVFLSLDPVLELLCSQAIFILHVVPLWDLNHIYRGWRRWVPERFYLSYAVTNSIEEHCIWVAQIIGIKLGSNQFALRKSLNLDCFFVFDHDQVGHEILQFFDSEVEKVCFRGKNVLQVFLLLFNRDAWTS